MTSNEAASKLDQIPDAAWREADRRRIGYHEVGHAVASLYLSCGPPTLVSLRPGQAYTAVSIGGRREAWSGVLDLGTVSILQPADLRRVLEVDIAISLAGKVAETLAGFRPVGYQAETTDDEDAAETASRALAALSPRHRELLADTEGAPTMPSDAELARAASFALTGSEDETLAHVAWLRVVVRRLLIDHREAVERLVEALLEAEVLDAEAIVRIVRATRCKCHSW